MNDHLNDGYWYYHLNDISSQNYWVNNQWIDFKTSIRIMLSKIGAIPEEKWHLEMLFEQ